MDKFDSKNTLKILNDKPNEFIKRLIFPSIEKYSKTMLFREMHAKHRVIDFENHNLTFYIDDEHKTFAYIKNNTLSRWYGFSDIINVELNVATHDNHSSSTDGYILHPPGSVGLVYSDTKHYVETYVDKMVLTISIDDPDYPEINITYLDFSCQSSSATFANIYKDAQEKVNLFLELSKKGGFGFEPDEIEPEISIKKQLEELKDLYNSKLISKKDYEEKKKQILKL